MPMDKIDFSSMVKENATLIIYDYIDEIGDEPMQCSVWVDDVDVNAEYYRQNFNNPRAEYKTEDGGIEQIAYVIHVDMSTGNTEILFDRNKDLPNPMPKLEVGDIVWCKICNTTSHIGVVRKRVDGNLIITYFNGGWNFLHAYEQGFDNYEILAIWKGTESAVFTPTWEKK